MGNRLKIRCGFDVLTPKRRRTRRTATDTRVRLGYPGFSMDLLVWTPERLREWSRAGDGFARDILERGQVLYEHRHP